MDSIDYYNRYAVPYYEKTVDADMGEVMKPFVELLPENAEVLDLGCGSGRDTLAEVNIDRDVLCMTYDEMDFDDVFDGIWACASLVHLRDDQMRSVLKKLILALHEDGILYFSVRKGDRDGIYGERYFRDYTKRELYDLLEEFPQLKVIDLWTTQDVLPGRQDRVWLNVLVKKVDPEV